MGYHRAGFEVVGVDIARQPRFPFEFIQADALAYLIAHGHEFDVIHASPPCQAFTQAQRIQNNEHENYIDPVRSLMPPGVPYIIENVLNAPLIDPITLCGAMFGLRTYRHRLFESNVPIVAPPHPEHVARNAIMGRRPKPDEFMHVVGNFIGVDEAKIAMGIDWMTRNGLREAIPPAYTEWIGSQILVTLESREKVSL